MMLLLPALLAAAHLRIDAEAWSASPIASRSPPTPTTALRSALRTTDGAPPRAGAARRKRPRFPVHPADALSPSRGYDAVVKSAYLRHILVASEEMAGLILDVYLRGGSLPGNEETYGGADGDVFARLARDVSLCPRSREDGGKIGWVDSPFHRDDDSDVLEKTNGVATEMIPPEAIREVFRRRVKGGDVVKLPSTDGGGWHLVRVDDLHVRLRPSSVAGAGSKQLINERRKRLKGSGNVPLSPTFRKVGGDVVDRGTKDDDGRSNAIYSVPDAKYYKIMTTGCQMNVADSERIMGALEGELGLKSVDGWNDAANDRVDPSLIAAPKSANKQPTPDVLLLNTCTIRDHAEQKVYDALGPYAARKRSGHPLAIVVAGCVAQQEGEALLRRFPEVDLVMGPQYIPWLGELLVEVGRGSQLCMTESMIWSERGGSGVADVDSSRDKDGEWMVPIKRGHSTRAWVNVIYGCNEHCTYCVVPGVRGVEQSRPMEAILQECLQLAASGYKEVTLLGQNIDAYGRDMSPRRTFADLLHYLNDNLPPDTVSRIRYVTSHPRYFSDRVIDAVANLDKVCECFHMPFQAGDDQVLKDMRRGYSYGSYMKIIKKIRAKAPDASICGDVIVGFPGESEEAFQRTLDLMDEVKFDNLNTFAYSPRPNTEAAEWDRQVPPDVRSDRLQRVQARAAEHALERSRRYLGRTVEVLVEDRNPKNGKEVMGRTRQGRQVFFPGNIDELKGEFAMVEILEARTWSLVGRMCESELMP